MPELPEVETIRSGLADLLPGKRIAGVEVLLKKSLSAPESHITTHMAGARVTHVRRRGKIMIVDLSSGYSLLVHLKMTGQLVFE
ncbi:formamidopyrimidine-DNA glycosylase, partial [Candidatus Saccharibacteria bacterium SW_7_54_9]